MVVFWWMRWRDVGCCSSLHERHISFDLSSDTGALLLARSTIIEVVRFRDFVSEGRGSLTQNRRNANIISKNDVFCILGRWDSSSGWTLSLLKSVFG